MLQLKKWSFSFIVLVLTTLTAVSQSISGKIVDEEGMPLEGAAVFLHELQQYKLSDEGGKFQFNQLKPGHYHFHFNFIGHKSVSREVDLDTGSVHLNITLNTSSLELKEITIEAAQIPHSGEETHPIEVVEEDFLQKNLGNNLVQTLEKIPGINAINTGIGISKPVIRGLSFNRVIVNHHGIKQEGQQWGADHGLEIDQFSAQRVELIKGPTSLLFGSDGLGGAINILPPPLPEVGIHSGEITGLYKTNNNHKAVSGMFEGNQSGWVYRLRLTGQQFDDYQVPADEFVYNTRILNIEDQRLKNTAGYELNGGLMFGKTGSWGHSTITITSFNQHAGMFTGALGRPDLVNLSNDGDRANIDLPRQIIKHFKVSSNSNIKLKKGWLEIETAYQENNRKEQSEPHVHGYFEIDNDNIDGHSLLLQTYSANLRYYYKNKNNVRSILGFHGSYRNNTRGGYEYLLPDFNAYDLGIFFHQHRKVLPRISISYGLRGEYASRETMTFIGPDVRTLTDTDSVTRNRGFTRSQYNYAAAFGSNFQISDFFGLKFHFGKSFRMPTAQELSVNGIHHGTFRHERGDSTLKSESGYQFDLEAQYERRNFLVKVSPYFNYFDDYIYLSPSPFFSELPAGGQIFRFRNHNAIYTGVEYFAGYHPIDQIHLAMSAEYVWNYNLETGLPLPFTPPLSGSFEAEYEKPLNNPLFKNISIGSRYEIFAAQNRVDRNEIKTPGYDLLDIYLHLDMDIFNNPLFFQLRANNVLNEQYLNHLSRFRILNLYEQGFNLIFQVKLQF